MKAKSWGSFWCWPSRSIEIHCGMQALPCSPLAAPHQWLSYVGTGAGPLLSEVELHKLSNFTLVLHIGLAKILQKVHRQLRSFSQILLPSLFPSSFLECQVSIIVWKSFLTNLALFPLYLLKTSPPINTHTSLLAPTTWGTFFGTCMPTKITYHGRESVIRYENPTVFY